MIQGLDKISIQELRSLDEPRVWSVEGHIDELPSLTPIRGELSAEHLGNALEVKGCLSTIVTLCCDRCLSQFNYRLECNSQELIWLGHEGANPADSAVRSLSEHEALMECLHPCGNFYPERWAFEQLNLQLPVVNRCGDECEGPQYPISSNKSNKQNSALIEKEESNHIDPRWATLLQLKSQ